MYSRVMVESKNSLGASPGIKARSRKLRRNMTECEKILWSKLRKKQQSGMYFRRQHPYAVYIIDFYCFKANLAIEVDGPIHELKTEYDMERTKFLESSGLTVLRFTNRDIKTRIDHVLEVINNYYKESSIF
jgi:very-short-patch-repair endonuclease